MKIITFSLLLICSVVSYAGEWIADKKSGCQVWNENPAANETINYSGTCSNGKAHGKGAVQWLTDGIPISSYDGEFVEGKLTGKGVLFDKNGENYEGNFLDGKLHGKGIRITVRGGVKFV